MLSVFVKGYMGDSVQFMLFIYLDENLFILKKVSVLNICIARKYQFLQINGSSKFTQNQFKTNQIKRNLTVFQESLKSVEQ